MAPTDQRRSVHASDPDRGNDRGSPAAGPVRRDAEADARTLERLRSEPRPPELLIRGGIVVTVDPALGTRRADVLVRDGKIAEIAPDLGASVGDSCVVVDATGTIVLPGLVDSHVHAWAGQMRGLAPAVDFPTYMATVHGTLAPHYRPHDIYVGTLLTALQALDGGVTTIIDNSHNSRSPEHSDAAVEALLDAGVRGVHAAGSPTAGSWDEQLPRDVLRLRDRYTDTTHEMLSVRLFDIKADEGLWSFARDHDLWMSHEMGAGLVDNLTELHAAGLLTSKHTFNHCFGTTDPDWKLIADAGAQVNLAPRSDATFGLGPAHPPVDAALRHGVRPGLSMDNEVSYSLDMFVEMQTLLNGHRARSFEAALTGGAAIPLSIADVLEFATLQGAANAGLDHRVGSLTPGKDADLVLVRTTDVNTAPLNSVAATLVGFAHRGNVDSVFVRGEVRKWRRRLVGHDLDALFRAAEHSRDRVLTTAGVHGDVLASHPPVVPV